MERKWCRLAEEEARAGAEIEFTSDGIFLDQVASFKYLGRILMAAENDFLSVVSNLRESRQNWAQLTKVLGIEGVYARILGQI